jgi:acyl-coenzyme A synthetase/AMP-(fatty) acid ligase
MLGAPIKRFIINGGQMTLPLTWKNEWLPLTQRFAGQRAVTDDQTSVTYEELFARAAGVAVTVTGLGAAPGQAVATYIPNSWLAVAASFGVTATGAAEAPINPGVSIAEAEHCLALAGAKILLTTRDRLDRLRHLEARLLAIEEIVPASFADLPPVPVDPATWGRIVFTSGTTGRPKGIVHTHGGRWLANLLLRSTLPIAPSPGEAILLFTPFSHGSGLLTYAFLDGGAAVSLFDGIDPKKVLRILEEKRADQIFAPPTVLAKLTAACGGRRIEGVRAIFCGTAPLSAELYRRARATFGPVVRITYGKSEIYNPITVLTPTETDACYEDGGPRGTCVGWPASGVEVVIGDAIAQDDEADGPSCGPILLRARHMLAGVLSEAGFEPHAADAFHRTGDLGFIDDRGRLVLAGRESDVMKTGGYRVTPDEIEAILRPYLESGELVVVGLPSSYWGEVITAVAVGAGPGWQDRLEPALRAMTPYKRPKLFAELGELPRNAMGKVVRARVRDAVLASYHYEEGRYPSLQASEVKRSR